MLLIMKFFDEFKKFAFKGDYFSLAEVEVTPSAKLLYGICNSLRKNDEIHNDEIHNDVGRQDIRKILYAIIYTIVILFVIFNFRWMNGCHNGIISENMGTWNALHEQLKRFLLK